MRLADVYAAIAFYLNHQPEVETYLKQRRQQSQEIRAIHQALYIPKIRKKQEARNPE